MNKKQCKYCKKYYPEEYFGVSLTVGEKVYRRRKCRDCYRMTKQALNSKIHEWIINYKIQRGCGNRGIVDQRVLDLHHPEESEKKFTVAYFRRGLGFDQIRNEVKKCEVLCANCHRILHWEKRNSKFDGA